MGKIKSGYRCDCPVTSAIDVLGDKWTLVIVKQMLLDGKRTFKDFSDSAESIASNILSARLKMLQAFGIIRKENMPSNRKTNIYSLTQKGLALTPLIVELALWSDIFLREYNPTIIQDPRLEMAKKDREAAAKYIVDRYKEKNW